MSLSIMIKIFVLSILLTKPIKRVAATKLDSIFFFGNHIFQPIPF